VTKKEIAKVIADRVGVTQTEARQIVQSVLDDIVDTLVREGRIELRNFGVFEVRSRKAHWARNPRTGERVAVPARAVVSFKPGREMLERVRQRKKVAT